MSGYDRCQFIVPRRFGHPSRCCAALRLGGQEAGPIAIKGYDRRLLHAARATPAWRSSVQVGRTRWKFSSAKHRDLFKADPVRYAPQFANFCAVALSRGEVREANPEYWLISDAKLYLFGKPIGPDLFRKDLNTNLERAKQNRTLLPKKP